MKNLVLLTLVCLPVLTRAQNIGIGTETPHASARLDVTATDKGMLVPRLSLSNVFSASPVSTPATGLLVWNTNEAVSNGQGAGFYFWTGSRWQKLVNAAEGWSLLGNNNVDTAVNFIGTINNAGLMFRVSNQKAGGIFPFGGNTFLGLHAGRFLKYDNNSFTGENNTFIGSLAGQNQRTGNFNTFVGSRAGLNGEGAFGNTFIGYQVGAGNTTGEQNTALGLGAGGSTTGSRNVSIGANTGSSLQNGFENIMIGYDVGSFLFDEANAPAYGNVWIGNRAATGNFGINPKRQSFNNVIIGDSAAWQVNGAIANVFVGKRSGMNSQSGQFNVFVGDSSGINNTSGQRNTFLGSKARGNTTTRVNATAVGANAEAGADNVLVLGSINGVNGATASVNVGIGTTAPTHRLYIRDGAGSGVNAGAPSLLVLDKTGQSNHLSILNDANNEMGLVFGKAGSAQPPFDGGIFYNTSGSGAMQFRNAGGLTRMHIHNNGNISIGSNSDIARLHIASAASLSGLSPTVNSSLVLDRGNLPQFLSMVSTGLEQGLVFGTSQSNIDGGIIYSRDERRLSFRTANTAARMVIDNSGNVGISTITPEYRLHVVTSDPANFGFREGIMIENTASGTTNGQSNTGEAAISFKNGVPDGTGTNQWIVGLNQNRNFAFAYGNVFEGAQTRVVIDSLGKMGIGFATPTERLHVNGNILATGTITPSDLRFKKNLLPMASILPQVMALRPMYYHWRQEEFPEYAFSAQRTFGVMAQDLEAQFPELVVTGSTGYKAVDYSRLSIVLLKALQEQQELIERQSARLNELQQRLEMLEKHRR